ncbi:hypothetical protein C7413_11833 [Paraburkholderia silvatlantica]|nr:hypothetical protein C7411_11933 [Paraburkholderia silvatlantica]PXW34453.1 hypothetical protein C7413_11833 [Paraburkholderia silvatlantica]
MRCRAVVHHAGNTRRAWQCPSSTRRLRKSVRSEVTVRRQKRRRTSGFVISVRRCFKAPSLDFVKNPFRKCTNGCGPTRNHMSIPQCAYDFNTDHATITGIRTPRLMLTIRFNTGSVKNRRRLLPVASQRKSRTTTAAMQIAALINTSPCPFSDIPSTNPPNRAPNTAYASTLVTPRMNPDGSPGDATSSGFDSGGVESIFTARYSV